MEGRWLCPLQKSLFPQSQGQQALSCMLSLRPRYGHPRPRTASQSVARGAGLALVWQTFIRIAGEDDAVFGIGAGQRVAFWTYQRHRTSRPSFPRRKSPRRAFALIPSKRLPWYCGNLQRRVQEIFGVRRQYV